LFKTEANPRLFVLTDRVVLLTHPLLLTGNDKLPGTTLGASHVARRLALCCLPILVLRFRHTFVAVRFLWSSPAELKRTFWPISGA
jgi:hypothetical protein